MKNPKIQLLSVLFLTLLSGTGYAQRYPKGLSPEESVKTFQLREEFGIEKFVSEPDVLAPVDMVFDGLGNIYVVEMGDYPYDAQPGNFKGRIRLLRDTNNDGKIDEVHVFAENLPSATSVFPWKGGIIVTAAPDILYLKDTNGDFKADTREVLYTGFFAKNSEAQITCLRLGVDNWIYANNSGQGGKVTSKINPSAPEINMAGTDFRFRLDRGGLHENESGTGQFGLAVNDVGHRFVSNNTIHIRQVVIPYRYIRRHNFMPSYRADYNISDHDLIMFQKSETPYWRAERTRRRQARFDSLGTGAKEHARDHFTGASGGTFFGGDGFPDGYYGNVFTGEVAGNLVHRDVLKNVPGSPLYVAQRDEKEKDREFLASTDTWFRPANFATGPDGYLYVVDMYAQHIETPVSIPDDLTAEMDYSTNLSHGRIWRIFPKNGPKRPVMIPNLSTKSSQELIELFSHPNQWWRQTAQRILLERDDKATVPVLKKNTKEAKNALGRLHSLYALDALNALEAGEVKTALSDPDERVREHAVILAERYPQYVADVAKLVNDPNPHIAFQATLSLGQFDGKKALPGLAEAIEKYGNDSFFRTAVLSSAAGSSPELAKLLAKRGTFFREASPARLQFLEDFAYVAGARNGKNEVSEVLTLASSSALSGDKKWQIAALNGLAKGARRSPNKGAADKAVVKAVQKLESKAADDVKKAINNAKSALGI